MNSGYIDVNIGKPLFEYCRNATNIEGDTFVGIKSEIDDNNNHNLSIHFPIGYRISQDEDEVRDEIINLLTLLQEYNDEQSVIPKMNKHQLLRTVKFPIQSFITVIMEYVSNGPYQLKEDDFVKGTSGSINWSRTIKKEDPIITEKGIVYSNYRVKRHTNTDKKLITEINKYCAYESYLKLGWIYRLSPLPKPIRTRENNMYRKYLGDLLLKATKDRDKRLFGAMANILDFTDNNNDREEFYFGTNRFEYIWERLVQDTYGNVDKLKYFPKAKWILRIGTEKEKSPLQPDTIMKYDEDVYILDAKYYKYGITKNSKHLPNSSDINKQISYGEFIVNNEKFIDDRNNGMKVYNAFLMPYNRKEIPFNICKDQYFSIGEAVADWKESIEDYERVQGILIDVKSLMLNSLKPNFNEIKKLSDKIVESLQKSSGVN